jgi:hypothetical protein
MKVMNYWLTHRHPSDYPPTWEGLCEMLEDVELAEVAVELRKAVEAAQDPI